NWKVPVPEALEGPVSEITKYSKARSRMAETLEATSFIPVCNGQLWQQVQISVNQRFLFCTGPALHLLFSVEGFIDAAIHFIIYQPNGQSLFGVVSTFAILVLFQSQIQIGRTASIIASVRTAQYVHKAFFHVCIFSVQLHTLPSTLRPFENLRDRSDRCHYQIYKIEFVICRYENTCICGEQQLHFDQ